MIFPMNLSRKLLTLIILVVCSSCGYQFGLGDLSQQYRTITVPYVVGDLNGNLTAAIVRQLTSSGLFEYCYEGGDLNLIVKIIDFRDENIGFRYDVNKKGEIVDSVIPVETRVTAIVEVMLVDSASGDVIRGPVRIAANEEFDHDYYESHSDVNVFSLGQLIDYDAARDAASVPLNAVIAEKIRDFIINS